MTLPQGLLVAVLACLIAVQAVQAQPFKDNYHRRDQEAAKTIFADRIVVCSESAAFTRAHISAFLTRVFPDYRHPAVVDGARAPLDASLSTVYVYAGVVPRTRGVMSHCVGQFPRTSQPIAEMIEEARRAVGRMPDFCKDQLMKRQLVCRYGGPTLASGKRVRGDNWRLMVSFSSVDAGEMRKSLLRDVFGLDYEFCEKEFDCSFLN